MNEKLLELSEVINNELRNHPLIIDVKKAEKEMEDNQDFMRSVMALERISAEYNDALRYNIPVEELQKKLFEAKYKLDTLEVVINYRQKYKKAQEYLDEISKIIFKDISKKLKINELLWGDKYESNIWKISSS